MYKSAFSCGILAKHSEQKSERSTIEKTIKKLNSKLTKTQSDVQHARMVVQKVGNSNSKRIEDIVVKEFPQRYVSCDLRNLALLNADVVLLAEKMKGSLPTRENVLPLLSDIVRKQDTGKFFDTAATSTRRLWQPCIATEKNTRGRICYPLSNSK
jgi:cellobiose-specific phosphotransferase system component IIB